jgi:hypothetical protein
MGGGEVARYMGKYGSRGVSQAVFIAAAARANGAANFPQPDFWLALWTTVERWTSYGLAGSGCAANQGNDSWSA